ncbi:MAG: hypothetical protein JW940_34385 [Polyangiaceae bacterium]|nr:hypothetical protein [Polyangiaceae bacterium]
MTRHFDQQQLVDSEQELLAGIQRILGPSASDQARVRRGLSACLAAGALAPELPASLLRARHGTRSVFGSVGVKGLGRQVVAAIAIGSAGFGAGLATGRVSSVDTETRAGAHVAVSVRPHEVLAPEARAGSVPRTPDTPDKQHRAQSTTARASGPLADGRAVNARSLTEEADALRRVGQALREGRPQMAGQMLDDLDARIPRGALGQERRAARLMVRCRTGDSGARTAARTWLAGHARSVYAPHVRASCDEQAADGGDSEGTE